MRSLIYQAIQLSKVVAELFAKIQNILYYKTASKRMIDVYAHSVFEQMYL